MPLSRAAAPLRKWPRGFPAQIPPPRRKFHASAPSLNAPRSPLARGKQVRSKIGDFGNDGLLLFSLNGDRDGLLAHITKHQETLLSMGVSAGILSPKLSPRTFLDVATKLIYAAYKDKPDERIIGRISKGL